MTKFWLIISLIGLVAVAYLLWQYQPSQEGDVSDVDTSAVIDEELNALNPADLEKEFEAINADVNAL